MKKNLSLLMLLITLTSSLSYSQVSQRNTYSDQFIRNCIIEVFQNQADELVFNSDSVRYSFMSNFMKHQVIVEYHPEFNGKSLVSTNSLSLNNKYNLSLQRDNSYDSSVFNPLKYQFSMNPDKKVMYRIGNTDYLMIVYPSK